MKSVESIVEEHAAQERRYQLLQASAMIYANYTFETYGPNGSIEILHLDYEQCVDDAEGLLAEIERRDQERRKP